MSHRLQTDCLKYDVIARETVEWIYDGRDARRSERLQIANLCRSHERLRHEVAGAEILRDDDATKIARLEAQVKQQQREIMDLRTELERERGLL
jgi:hypothetical protein